MRKSIGILSLLPLTFGGCLSTGCISSYPRIFDDPKFQAAMIDAFKDGVKQLHAKGEVNNPGVRVQMGYFFSANMEDIHADFDASVASGEQPLGKRENKP